MQPDPSVKAIRLRHFRCFEDTGFVNLSPLTILVGRNSSGKSTFLRFLPLLRQSIESRTTGPIQWHSDYVDFGGFRETLSSFASRRQIHFQFTLSLQPDSILRSMRYSTYGPGHILHDESPDPSIDCHLGFTIVPDPKDNSTTRFRSLTIHAAGQQVEIATSNSGRVARVVVNGQHPFNEPSHELITIPGSLLPNIRKKTKFRGADSRGRYPAWAARRPLAVTQLTRLLAPMFHGNTSWTTMAEVPYRVPFGTDATILASLKALKHLGKHWAASVDKLSVSSPRFAAIRNLLIANSLAAIVQHLEGHLLRFAAGVRYLKPIRATAQRYYRPQDLAVGEMDPEGKNFAMFLRSLNENESREFNEWVSSELGWEIAARLRGGHVSVNIGERGSQGYNLTDVGFGFSQLLPVIAQIWMMQRSSLRGTRRGLRRLTLAIEQPELHLHPGLQARLADILIRAIEAAERLGIAITLVIETHSEAIVNQIGRRIARGELDAEKASVVVFGPVDGNGASPVSTATFDTSGFLVNWPYGFFEPE